ncbi:MAG: hypothetical protein RBR81_03280 [Bacteroidales bacterium]|jgi:hypothetical protein|nr:hypothetical protein [Bacteroidales bacterium]
MKNKKFTNSRNTKFVRIDNSTWIEANVLVPDEVAKLQFLQKVQQVRPGLFSGQIKNDTYI